MESLGSILSKKIVKNEESNKKSRKINTTFEQAREFGDYVGLPTLFILRLFKVYGKEKVLGIKSWLKDVPFDPARGGKIGLAIWKLKQ